MPVYSFDPLTDARWDKFVETHPKAGVFHSRGWLEALHRTYGYQPIAFTTSNPGKSLQNSIVFCDVKSWITGRRLVSLPFSDHCDPLVDSAATEAEILAYVRERILKSGYRYAEIRPMATVLSSATAMGLQQSEKYYLHTLLLEPPPDTLFRNLHKDCIQRKIRRAETEKLVYENGRSEHLLRGFYQLMLRTRRRHCLPPQPFEWFRNLASGMGERLTVRMASKDQRPVAALLTLSFKSTVTYKYGCSDERFNALGGTPFLFWKTIQEANQEIMGRLDLGRSELENAGLTAFKDRLGAQRRVITYWHYGKATAYVGWHTGLTSIAKRFCFHLPDTALTASGRFLYKHFG